MPEIFDITYSDEELNKLIKNKNQLRSELEKIGKLLYTFLEVIGNDYINDTYEIISSNFCSIDKIECIVVVKKYLKKKFFRIINYNKNLLFFKFCPLYCKDKIDKIRYEVNDIPEILEFFENFIIIMNDIVKDESEEFENNKEYIEAIKELNDAN